MEHRHPKKENLQYQSQSVYHVNPKRDLGI